MAPDLLSGGADPGPADEPGDLLERSHELELVAAAVSGIGEGVGKVLLIEGRAGLGKSRLLGEVRTLAAKQRVRVLSARASELEREFAFGVVRQLLERVVNGDAGAERWLLGPAQASATVFGPPREGEEGTSFALLHGLYWLVANLAAERPLLLAVDDLQWCDRPSLRFLAYLVRRLEGLPVLVVGALRSADPGTDPILQSEIARDDLTRSLHLTELGEEPTRTLIRQLLGVDPDPEFAAACHRATSGNPLLLQELLRAMRAEGVPPDADHLQAIRDIGPRAVSRTVLIRLAHLPGEAIELARVVAVLGEGVPLATVSAAAGLDARGTATAAELLARAEILRPELPLGFVHPLVRDAVYRELAPVERELRHAEAARLLRDVGAPGEQIAAHVLAVSPGGAPWAVEVLRGAARSALRMGGPESAVAYLRRALDEPPPEADRHRVLFELGMAEAMVSAGPATEHLEAALPGLRRPAERGLAASTLARMLLFTRPPAEALEVASRAAAELGEDLADLRRALEALELYAVHFGAPQAQNASRLLRARGGIRDQGAGARMLAAVAAWDWALTGGGAGECVELALAALRDGELVAADPAFMTVVAIGVLVLADRDEALPAWEDALVEAQRRGSLEAVSGVHIWRGWTWLERGELEEAETSLLQALEESRLWNTEDGAGVSYAVGLLARVRVQRGDLPGAREALGQRRALPPGSDGDGILRRAHIELLLAEARNQEAAAAAESYAATLGRVVNPAWAPWRSLRAEALPRDGEGDGEARRLLEEEVELARGWGAPGALGRALRLLGERTGRVGLLREAVAVTAATPARLEQAKALAALGRLLRHGRRPTEAREPLHRALDLAGRCGARRLAELAHGELLASGARPRRQQLTGAGSLTPSERRVAELAAEGRTNREIAERLYITPKTVEIHLSSSYRKLQIRSRQGLRQELAGSA